MINQHDLGLEAYEFWLSNSYDSDVSILADSYIYVNTKCGLQTYTYNQTIPYRTLITKVGLMEFQNIAYGAKAHGELKDSMGHDFNSIFSFVWDYGKS